MGIKKSKKLLAEVMCAALLFADAASVGITAFAADAEQIYESETQDSQKNMDTEDGSERIVESEMSEESVAESCLEMKTQEEKPETKSEEAQTQKEPETTETEGIAAEESEVVETEGSGMSNTETENSETQELLVSDDDIASGVIDEDYGHITWVIDKNGKLTVEGTGDFSDMNTAYGAPWYDNNKNIVTAKIKVTGLTNARGMFIGCNNLTSLDLGEFDTSVLT